MSLMIPWWIIEFLVWLGWWGEDRNFERGGEEENILE